MSTRFQFVGRLDMQISMQYRIDADEGVPRMNRHQQTAHTNVTIDPSGIAHLEITNAGVLNVLGKEVAEDVTTVVGELATLADVRALIVRGSGERAFVGGADIKQMAGFDNGAAKKFITALAALCDALRLFPTPVIARLAGWSLGAGLEVAAACDIRISASDAHFGMPEVAVGIPSVIHATLLPRLIGSARASWLMLTARNIDAPTALSWGLIDEVCSPSDLTAAVDRTAGLFVELGSAAVRQQKRLLREWEDMTLDDAIRASIDEFGSAFDTGEPQRFMANFVNRQRHG